MPLDELQSCEWEAKRERSAFVASDCEQVSQGLIATLQSMFDWNDVEGASHRSS